MLIKIKIKNEEKNKDIFCNKKYVNHFKENEFFLV